MTRRIHVGGGPGSGKTWSAQRIAHATGLPFYELDRIPLNAAWDMARVRGEDRASVIASQPEWVTDGVYFDWARPLLERAERILWLDVPWRVASYRIIARHIKADLSRRNEYPGWAQLRKFWKWSYRYYHDDDAHVLNEQGAPLTRACAIEQLQPYQSKLVVCRDRKEASLAVRKLSSGGDD